MKRAFAVLLALISALAAAQNTETCFLDRSVSVDGCIAETSSASNLTLRPVRQTTFITQLEFHAAVSFTKANTPRPPALHWRE